MQGRCVRSGVEEKETRSREMEREEEKEGKGQRGREEIGGVSGQGWENGSAGKALAAGDRGPEISRTRA